MTILRATLDGWLEQGTVRLVGYDELEEVRPGTTLEFEYTHSRRKVKVTIED